MDFRRAKHKTVFRKISRNIGLGAVLLTSLTGYASAQSSTEKAWKILDDATASSSMDKRVDAVSVLGLISKNRRSEELAIKALSDNKAEVRTVAANALGTMNARSSILALKKALKDSDVGVVLAAAHSLLLLKDKTAYEVYYAVLTGERKSGGGLLADQRKMLDDHQKMATFAFETGVGFIPFGGISLTAVKALTKDDSSPVRAAAAKLLANDPDPRSAEALLAAASDKNWVVRAAALDAIGRRGDPALAPKIESHLDDEKDLVQDTAAAAIIHLTEAREAAPKPPVGKPQ